MAAGWPSNFTPASLLLEKMCQRVKPPVPLDLCCALFAATVAGRKLIVGWCASLRDCLCQGVKSTGAVVGKVNKGGQDARWEEGTEWELVRP